MSVPFNEMKTWLNEKLGREVTVSLVKIQGVQCYLADYVNHTAPAKKLASESEEGAIVNLFNYLHVAEQPRIDIQTNNVGTTNE
jgi:hypothetical protein